MTIKVGIPVSLTGQFRLQGRQTLAGIRTWADDVNRRGGLVVGSQAHPVELIWYDDGSRRDAVITIVRQLIVDERVDLLVGPYSSVLTNAAAGVAWEHRKLLWNQGGASPLLYQRGNPFVVGILTPADQYLSGLLPAVHEICPDASTVGIVRAATGAFPRDVASGVEVSAVVLGFRIVLSLEFDAAADDFRDVVEAVGKTAPDVLVVAGRFQNDLRIAELLAGGFPPVGAVAVVAAGVDAFRERLREQVEGFMGPSQWETDAGYAVEYGPGLDEVRASLTRAGHPVIDYPMAQAYAVGVVMQRCIEACGSLEDGALREAASSLDFTTYYGRFRIDPATGSPVDKPSLLVQWQQGRKVVVWPPGYRQERLAYPWRQRSIGE